MVLLEKVFFFFYKSGEVVAELILMLAKILSEYPVKNFP